MTPERKAEIVEAIVKQFEVTGLRPARGAYRKTIGGVACACAVGVFADGGGVGGPRSHRQDYGRDFLYRFRDLEISVVDGIEAGFDFDFDAASPVFVDSDDEDFRVGHEIGAAAWECVGHLAPGRDGHERNGPPHNECISACEACRQLRIADNASAQTAPKQGPSPCPRCQSPMAYGAPQCGCGMRLLHG